MRVWSYDRLTMRLLADGDPIAEFGGLARYHRQRDADVQFIVEALNEKERQDSFINALAVMPLDDSAIDSVDNSG